MTNLYIPSKSRTWILPQTLPSWVATGLRVTLVVDDAQAEEYEEAVAGAHSKINILPVTSRGIGAARQAALADSMLQGHEFHYQIDDDHIAPANATDLMDALVAKPHASFVSAWKRQLNFYLEKLLVLDDEIVYTESNMTAGLRLIRNEPLASLGGFDSDMLLAEDCEAHMRTGWRNGVRPLLHKGVEAKPVGQRFQPGGCQAEGGPAFSAKALDTVMLLNEKYGEGTASYKPWGRKGDMRFSIHIAKFWKRVDELLAV